jgi:hypothetical protein
LRNGVIVPTSVSLRGTNAVLTITLPGVGEVRGVVVGSDGVTPVANAEVSLQMSRAPFEGVTDTAITDSQGRFTFRTLRSVRIS